MCIAKVGADVEAQEVEDVVADTGGQVSPPEAICIPEAAFWADDDTCATAGSFSVGAVTTGCFFLAADVVLRDVIKISIEKSDNGQKSREKRGHTKDSSMYQGQRTV